MRRSDEYLSIRCTNLVQIRALLAQHQRERGTLQYLERQYGLLIDKYGPDDHELYIMEHGWGHKLEYLGLKENDQQEEGHTDGC